MADLQLQELQFLQEFEEFNRTFLAPYDPCSTINVTQNNYTICFEQMDEGFFQKMESELNPELLPENFDASPLVPTNQTKTTINPPIDLPTFSSIDEEFCNPILGSDVFPFNPWVLEMINFEIPTNRSQTIDMAAYVSKAADEYGEEFAKKVEENLMILLEAMNRRSGCCDGEGKVLCCNGKCWGYMESRWRAMQHLPRNRGRRRKGSKISPEESELRKEYQKIRNRVSAARSHYNQKNHIRNLEGQVRQLRSENKIRRNLVKFLECSPQLPAERRSLSRTMSGPPKFKNQD